MIDLYYHPTPNGRKITLALEELQLPYRLHRINILKNEQHSAEFLAISPNNKIPAIIDTQPNDSGEAISIFESGAILIYLADKAGQLMPKDVRGRTQVIEWLMWQKSSLGPMGGQANHFNKYAREQVPYAIERYTQELNRLYRVLNTRLTSRDYICDNYSIADIACYGWVDQAIDGGVNIEDYPHIERWFTTMTERPALQRAMVIDKNITAPKVLNNKEHESLFGQRD